MHKKFFFLLFFLPYVLPYGALQAEEISSGESIKISTYYPSPYGAYRQLKLYPLPDPSTPECDRDIHKGNIYNDLEEGTVKICNEISPGTYRWESLAGFTDEDIVEAKDFCITDKYGGKICLSDVQDLSDAQQLVNAAHTVGDCKGAGGEAVGSDTSLPVCRFNMSACPAGWTQYKYYAACPAVSCSFYGSSGPSVVSPPAKPWGNGASRCCPPFWGASACRNYDCPSIAYATYNTKGESTGGYCCTASSYSGTSLRTQIGCY